MAKEKAIQPVLGFVGLGVMGKPMATNLIRAGFPVIVFNRSKAKCESLVPLGAAVAQSLSELAAQSDAVITIVSDTMAVEDVIFGQRGLFPGFKRGTTVIDMSTISAKATVEFARRLESKGCEMLDAPVSGGEKKAADGTLGIMVGGRKEVFDKFLPVLQALGNTITYTGPIGNGQKTKMVNQLVGATNLLAVIEGLRLASAAGLDPETTLRAVASGSASSWMLVNAGPRILENDFAPGFSIRLQHKDLMLLGDMVDELGGDFPAARLVYQLFARAMERGLGDYGNHGLIKVWDQNLD